MLAAPLTTPLCLYNTKLNFTFPLQSISLRDITPLCLCHSSHFSTLFHFAITVRPSASPLQNVTLLFLCKTCPSINSQYCAKPSQCITVLFHYAALPYIVFVTPLCLHNALPNKTLPYHYITPHGHSIHRCSFTMRSLPFPTNPLLYYSVSLLFIT